MVRKDMTVEQYCGLQVSLQRRSVAFGLIAAMLSLARVSPVAAYEHDAPYFRSGRFQFTLLRPRVALPSAMLFPLHGTAIDLGSLRGRPILLNFWATWCEACRTELPILDRLARERRRSELAVIAVSEDRAARAVVERFVEKLSIRSLNVYLDPNGYLAFSDTENKRKAHFALYGMPITYAVTVSGWVIGYMPGAADWESPAAGRLIEFLRSA